MVAFYFLIKKKSIKKTWCPNLGFKSSFLLSNYYKKRSIIHRVELSLKILTWLYPIFNLYSIKNIMVVFLNLKFKLIRLQKKFMLIKLLRVMEQWIEKKNCFNIWYSRCGLPKKKDTLAVNKWAYWIYKFHFSAEWIFTY